MANVAALSPEQIRQIDELCDAMDRECIMAGTATGPGQTILDVMRAHWTKCAEEGRLLPERWCCDKIETAIQERFAEFGVREWRKAYPWLVGDAT